VTEQFHRNFGVLLAFVAALFALLFFWTYQVYSLNAPTRWLKEDRHFADITDNREQVMSLVGFHGMIHNFKDYLLRDDPADKAEFFRHFEAARAELTVIRQHFGAAAEADVAAIDAALRNYFVSLNRIDQLRGEGRSIAEIDATININDDAAFAAFGNILKLYEAQKSAFRNQVVQAIEQDSNNLQSLYTTLFAIGLLLTVAVVMGLRFEYLKRRAVRERSETKSLLESFLDHSTVPFLIAGPDKIIRHCNLAAAKLLETKPENLIGASLSQIIEAPIPDNAAMSFETGRARRIATEIELQSGRKIPVRADFSTNRAGTMRIVALFDQSSEIRIRERLLVEAEHRLANDTIDESLAIRRDIQKLTDLVGDFTREAEAVGQDFGPRAQEIATSLKQHLADFLDSATAMSEGRLAVGLNGPAKQKISKTLADALAKFDKPVQERQLLFNWVNHVPDGREIDFPAQLHRILCTLVSNAINYTKPGGAVKISTSLEEETLILKVEDTGIGIEEADIPRIFERGVRLKNAAQMAGGLGLGLHAAGETLRHLGGEIICNSYAGIGSDFVVRIPLVQQAQNVVTLPRGERKEDAPRGAQEGI
jgi:signal transduction histidine kinase